MKKLGILAIFCWNIVLYMLATGVGIVFSQEGLYPIAVFYLVVGALSSFWTTHLLLTAVPSIIAFPFVVISFASAVISDDTQGKAQLSFWDTVNLLDREHIESLIIAVAAAVIGWLVTRFAFRTHGNWALKAKPYVFSFTVGIVLLYFVLLITN